MGLRDMFSAISGLQANSTWLDVIGNNISNTNTVAYKASRVEFADQISQTLYGGTGDNQGTGMGGVNPEQVGLGTRVASIQTLFTEGTLQQTGNSTDIAIVGNGFLVSKSGDNTYLTRAGNLSFDSAGNLVDQNGGLIQGLTATVQYTTSVIDANNGLNMTSAKLGFATTSAASATNIQIPRDMTEPPNATTKIDFSGNLDSFLQATDSAHGGVINVGTAAAPVLPIANGTLNGAVFNFVANAAGGQSLQQVDNADQGVEGAPPDQTGAPDSANWTEPLMFGAESLPQAQGLAGNYAWEQQPPVNPAQQVVETVYDSEGNPRQVTINFYQVNDLGDGGINSPTGPNQVAYAWYAFDTTNGQQVNTADLIGGTGIFEGDINGASYSRTTGNEYWGDLLVFNTDGSLLSTGGVEDDGGVGFQSMPDIYLPPLNDNPPSANAPASPLPTQGAQITQIQLNFGTAGILGQGQRDGIYSDAEGSYQVVNGVNTYVPQSTAYAKDQDGYAAGILTGVNFDATGTIQGTFSNGQTTAIGQVVIAMPNNQEGLNKVGSNYYQASSNSGAMFVGFAGQDGVGTVQGDTLELSNVDLTVELSNMIIAQRGFDVNSRVIAVENSNLQILSQLGQGG
jgi:flagellar hook protein FlgE